MLKAYVDGACSFNGTKKSIASWAFVILDNQNDIIIEKNNIILNGTNNIAELTAINESILSYKTLNTSEKIIIYSDSAYCVNGLTSWIKKWEQNGWKKNNNILIKNKDLWIEINKNINNNILIEKIFGHFKDNNEQHRKWNDYVDKKAKIIIKNKLKEEK